MSALPPDILLKEVHHRMKNHMATLVGLFTLQSSQSDDERVTTALTEAASRAHSMMVLYDRLYQQDHVHRLDVASFLPTLASDVIRLFSCCREVDLRVHVSNDSVSARQAQPLALLVNEIVSNSMKHAFADHEAPRVELEFSCSDETCALVVSDNGRGSETMGEDSHTGFGTQLVEMLVEQLRGTLAVATDQGMRVTVTFPRET